MILLYRGTSAISRAIQFQTRSKYSHAAWALDDGSIVEAWHSGGVRHQSSPFANHTPGTEIDVYDVPSLDPAARAAIETFLFSELGSGYDFDSVLRFLLRRAASGPSAEKWFCSELVHAALRHVGQPLLAAEDWEIAPGHLPWSLNAELVYKNVTQAEWAEMYGGGEAG